jgi:IclR family acetate operon transcriptional repressor
VGYTAVELAARIRERGGLLSGAEPYLSQLVELTGESANLAVLDGQAAVYVAHVAAPRTVRMFTRVGNRAPLHASGTGKVLLANLAEERREALIGELALMRHTPMTITDRDPLRRELEAVRRLGYALDNGEFEEGVSCVAVPVRDATDQVVAAVSVSGPASRLTRDRAELFVPQIQGVVAELSRTLGSKHPSTVSSGHG